ncbi:hypothetical protein HPB48_017002 [Haemaphysalis longicornis]|uniref:BTB domain-containing protein n=1 Tax=Haemaphysalis longicornis TaxID=44386 RepID=A0A9J6G6W3_HAELO|nr:hypothetical protein HPB48_017002 [Haemaphysalis longicornis]
MVPGLTYAGAVLCPSAATKEYLERRQREVGRLALGSHRTTPNEAVQGDMGWSSFAAREATAKLSFEMRAWTLGETNWVYRVRRSLLFTARSTRWTKRVRALSEKYGVPLPALCNLKDTTMTRAKVETQQWAGRAAAKPALHFYVAHKRERYVVKASILTTQVGVAFCSKRDLGRCEQGGGSAICELCGEEEESIEHVVLSCPRLEPKQPSGVSLEQALGFGQTGPSGGAAATSDGRDRGAVTAIIDRTKRRLEVWRSRTMAWFSVEAFLDNGFLTDGELAVRSELFPDVPERKFRCHKLFLAMRSEVFNAMFYGDLAEQGTVEVVDGCTDYINKKLNASNICSYLNYYARTREPDMDVDVVNRVLTSSEQEAQKVLSSEELVLAEEYTVDYILENIKRVDEIRVAEALMRWAQEQCVKSLGCEKPLELRFLTMTTEDLISGPAAWGIMDAEECLCVLRNIVKRGSQPLPGGFCDVVCSRF